MAKTKIVLLHERLSRDDELQGESFSIPPNHAGELRPAAIIVKICPGWGLYESRPGDGNSSPAGSAADELL